MTRWVSFVKYPSTSGSASNAAARAQLSSAELPAEYAKFQRMLKAGIPRVAVEAKASAAGLDASMLFVPATGATATDADVAPPAPPPARN